MNEIVAQLASQRNALASRLSAEEQQVKSLAEQKKHTSQSLAATNTRKVLLASADAVRIWCDEHGLPRFLPALLLPVPGIAIAFVLGGLLSAFMVAAVIAAASVFLWFVPGDDALRAAHSSAARECDGLAATLASLDAGKQTAESNIARLRDALGRAEAEHAAATQTRDYKLANLYSQRWKEMRGGQFEDFLALVFRELGYEVEQTGKSGDQGVDLIAIRQGRRIAVQAKGYVESVGNAAVQQAYTGKTIYACHSCAVITNSRFTASAQEAADKVQCILIDEEKFEDFIMGRMSIK